MLFGTQEGECELLTLFQKYQRVTNPVLNTELCRHSLTHIKQIAVASADISRFINWLKVNSGVNAASFALPYVCACV